MRTCLKSILSTILALLILSSKPVFSLTTDSHANQVKTIKSLVSEADSEKDVLVAMTNGCCSPLPKSKIGKWLHFAVDPRLSSDALRNELLETVPSSDLEMEAFLEFTLNPGNEQFRPLLRTYYQAVFKAASLNSRFLPRIFNIAREFGTQNWPDYDNIDWYCDQLKDVKKANPKAFEVAARLQKPYLRNYVVGCASSPDK